MEKFEVKIYEDRDYPMICAWWIQQKWKPIRKSFLSSFGVIVYHNLKPICCAWLYANNSKLYLLEFLVCNPNAPLKIKPKAIKYLVELLVGEAKTLGAEGVVSFVSSGGLSRVFAKAGFAKSEGVNISEMVRICQ